VRSFTRETLIFDEGEAKWLGPSKSWLVVERPFATAGGSVRRQKAARLRQLASWRSTLALSRPLKGQ